MSFPITISDKRSDFSFTRLTDEEGTMPTIAASSFVETADAPAVSEAYFNAAPGPDLKAKINYLMPGKVLWYGACNRFGHTITAERQGMNDTVITTQFQVWVDPDLEVQGLPIAWGEIIQKFPNRRVEIPFGHTSLFSKQHYDHMEQAAIDINEQMKMIWSLKGFDEIAKERWSSAQEQKCREFMEEYFDEVTRWYKARLIDRIKAEKQQ